MEADADTVGVLAIGSVCGALVMVLFIAPFITGLMAGDQFYNRE